jgi:hypothetical protein
VLPTIVEEKIMICLVFACIQVYGIERHNLFVSLAPGVEHPQSMEPRPQNVQRCYVEEDHDFGARAGIGKSPVTTDQSKKRVGGS